MNVGATLGALAAASLLTGCGGHAADRSSQIAHEIGASSCTATDYQLVNRLDNSKTRIYDCTMDTNPIDANSVQTFGSRELCVTEENGIANDVTEEAKLLFENNLSGGSPACAG